MLNLVRQLYLTGNAYALGLRNDRYEIDELHLMDPEMSVPTLAYDGSLFYTLLGNEVVERRINYEQLVAPQRDVLHVRLNTTKRYPKPLFGVSPLVSAAADIGVGSAIARQQMNFYMNEARPSAVLSTDMVLDKDQVQALRDRWNEQTRQLKQGGTPILTAGLKVQPWATHAGKESAIADMLRMSKENVALVFRVPLQILGIGGTPYSSTEALMRSWIASGLGFCLNHIEEAFDLLYGLKGQPDEYTEFDTSALLRSAMKERIDALARGVQGGIFSPNEARSSEGLDHVEYGDEPRVQQQVVPLSAASQIGVPKNPFAGPLVPPAPPAAGPTAPKVYRDDVQREIRKIIAGAERIGRNRMSP
jgi:HK97 family phage portal protein